MANIGLHWVDFRFQLNSTGRWVTPPVSWHLRSEEQKAIDNAWNIISDGPKVVDFLQHLGLARNLTTEVSKCMPPLRIKFELPILILFANYLAESVEDDC